MGRIIVSGAVAPSTTAEWGSLTGSIATQTDLVQYINENAPSPAIATTSAAGIVKPASSGSGSLYVYGDSTGRLTAQMPTCSNAGGLCNSGTTIYTTDGT